MTRIDLTTRDLHELIQPVLPHASTDKDDTQMSCISIEVRDQVLYAVASDRYSIAATRHPLAELAEELVILIDRTDAAAMLRLFTFTKEEDPKLTVIIDEIRIPVSGTNNTVNGRGLRIDSEDGTRLILHDRSIAGEPWPMAKWRTVLGAVIHRSHQVASPSVILTPALMPRWAKAAGKGERLMAFVGPTSTDPILITVEEHFAGLWKPCGHLDSDKGTDLLDGSPWRDELPAGA